MYYYQSFILYFLGTDSRLGVGFRFGEHSDFQILVELGPQFYTDPIGNEKKDENSIQKRAVSNVRLLHSINTE